MIGGNCEWEESPGLSLCRLRAAGMSGWNAQEEDRIMSYEVATATENPTIPVRIHQNHLTNSPNGAMNGDA